MCLDPDPDTDLFTEWILAKPKDSWVIRYPSVNTVYDCVTHWHSQTKHTVLLTIIEKSIRNNIFLHNDPKQHQTSHCRNLPNKNPLCDLCSFTVISNR